MNPSKVDRYEIREEIGGNERGTVYRAFDPQSNRDVAVKLLESNSLFTLTAQRKFSQQFTALKALSHPALLPILDFGEEANHPFIATTLMEGNLTQRMTGEPMPVLEALDMFRTIGEALDYAEAAGQYHLDMKPNNILFDTNGRPYVGDLGLVQVIDSLSAAKRPQVNPYYTSPEQVRKRPVNAASHVYSLAAMLFHVLTGQVLFAGASDMVAGFKHTSENPRNIRTLRSELTPAFDAVIQRALEKRPEERYPTCAVFIGELYRAQGGTLRPEDVAQTYTQPDTRDRFPRQTGKIIKEQPLVPRPSLPRAAPAIIVSSIVFSLVLCIGGILAVVLLMAQP